MTRRGAWFKAHLSRQLLSPENSVLQEWVPALERIGADIELYTLWMNQDHETRSRWAVILWRLDHEPQRLSESQLEERWVEFRNRAQVR